MRKWVLKLRLILGKWFILELACQIGDKNESIDGQMADGAPVESKLE